MDFQATEMESASSPTRSAQEVLRRMSLNSPPSRADNPRQVKRPKLLATAAGAAGASSSQAAAQASSEAAPSSQAFAAPLNRPSVPGSSTGNRSFVSMATPARKTAQPRRGMLAAPSPMPSWGSQGMNLRDASAGEVLEASDPSSYYPSFQLDCLRQPEEGPSSNSRSPSPPPSPTPSATSTATAMDDDEAAASSSAPGDDHFAPPPSPARLKMRAAAAGARGGAGERAGVALALEEAKSNAPGGGQGTAVPETPVRRPGSGIRSRLDRVSGEGGGGYGSGGEHSCSPVRGYSSGFGSDAQGSPVKKRGVGRWRLSVGGGGSDTDGDGFPGSPPLSNRNPFSPAVGGGLRGATLRRGGNGDEDDAPNTGMPAPPPRRSRASPGGRVRGAEDSPMDTADAAGAGLVDFGAIAVGSASGKGDEGSFLRRVSTGSCVSLADACGEGGGGGKASKDLSKPSPCDVTAFAPITPFRDGFEGMSGADSGGRDDAPMSPVPGADGGMYVPAGKAGGLGVSGRFATDFEELEVIGSGSFGTVYKVRSRVDGCLYAVKCTRRRFKGRADRQDMLREVYALAAVGDAQDTINIVRYHQAWIEDERLYIQTELCETSLEKQLENGERLEITGVYAFLRQTLLGLDILHQHNLVHLDIKPGNIFVKNGQYKLGDFGLVTTVHVGSGADVVEGDSRYMSKELLSEDHSNLTKCDVFSLGITLYEIISGRPLPPNGEEWHKLRSGKVGMPMGLPAELSKTLTEMMHPDPKCRPSAAELLRFPCLQSEMERQLNEQVSQLHKERSHNDDLLKEVSALIQKQSQRSGRLSRTITWDNSYFTKSDPGPLFSQYEGSAASTAAAAARAPAGPPGGSGGRRPTNPSRPLGEMPPFTSRGRGLDRGQGGGLFNPCPLKSGAFGGGDSAPSRFGAGFPSTLRGGVTGNAAGAGSGVSGGGGGSGVGLGGGVGVGGGLGSLSEGGEEGVAAGPVTFERLRQSPTGE